MNQINEIKIHRKVRFYKFAKFSCPEIKVFYSIPKSLSGGGCKINPKGEPTIQWFHCMYLGLTHCKQGTINADFPSCLHPSITVRKEMRNHPLLARDLSLITTIFTLIHISSNQVINIQGCLTHLHTFNQVGLWLICVCN